MKDSDSQPLASDRNGRSKPSGARRSPPGQPPTPPQEGINLLDMMRRRWWVVAIVGLLGLIYLVPSSLRQQTQYVGGFRLLVEPINNANASLSDLNGANSSPAELDYATQIQVLRSSDLLDRSVEKLQPFYPGLNYNTLVSGLAVSQLRGTKIIEVQYRSSNSAEVVAVLEQISKDYLAYSLSERQTNLRQGLQFVQTQLDTSQERVDELQRRLQSFRQSNQFLEPDSRAAQVASQSEQLTQQQLTLEQELKQARTELSRLQDETGAIAALNGSDSYQELVGQLRTLEAQIAQEKTRFQEDSLTVRVLREQQTNLLNLLSVEAQRTISGKAAEISNQIQILEVQQQAIAQTQATLAQQFQRIPGLSRQYTDLQRELQIATESLNRFLAVRETLQVEAAQKEIPWQLVEPPPEFAASVAPNTTRSLMMNLAMSIALGVGAAFLLEKLDKTFHSAESIGRRFKLPVLAVIPLQSDLLGVEHNIKSRRRKSVWRRIKTQAKQLQKSISGSLPFMPQPDDYDVFEFQEAFNLLRTNLQMMQAESSPEQTQTIVITSAQAGDGKSTVAWYLAQTAASMGQRVLLVDADLRRSQLQTRLKLPEAKGLGELFSSSLALHEVIQQPLPESSLHVLLSGEAALNPIQILASSKMHTLADKLEDAFDLVIYDAPPLNGLADALQLASYIDSLLLVVRLNKTDKTAVGKALESLSNTQVRLLGLVVNGL